MFFFSLLFKYNMRLNSSVSGFIAAFSELRIIIAYIEIHLYIYIQREYEYFALTIYMYIYIYIVNKYMFVVSYSNRFIKLYWNSNLFKHIKNTHTSTREEILIVRLTNFTNKLPPFMNGLFHCFVSSS